MSAHSEASKAVVEVFRNITPFVEGLSIDEAFHDVGGLRRPSGSPVEIASRSRRSVLDEVGFAISVGVARTKFLAKVAREFSKSTEKIVGHTKFDIIANGEIWKFFQRFSKP